VVADLRRSIEEPASARYPRSDLKPARTSSPTSGL
jgi:hypothetical protein